jgi:aminoglycoside phosphotransferase (APT) family kinase protein
VHEFAEKVKRIFDLEAGRPKKVTDPREVPSTYEAITAEWLTKILCRDTAGAKVASFSFGEPDDGSSNRRRIFVTYNEAGQKAGLPPSVFCKAAASVRTRTVLAESGTAEAEANYYAKARPRIDMVAPDTFYTGYDPETYAYLIMMKDLGKEVEFPDERHETTRQQAENQIDTLARLHSRFYESPELGTAALPFVKWNDWWPAMMKASPEFGSSCDRAFVDSEHIMSPALFKRRAEVWPKTMASAAAHAKLPRMLIHNDVHLKNWFITGDNRMGLHDWQCVGIGHWGRDVIYTITTALTVEQRRAWEKDLIALYLEKMAERGVPKVSTEDAWKNLRQQLMTALAFWTITLRPAPEMADMQPERTTWVFLKRFYTAIEDHDALDAFD